MSSAAGRTRREILTDAAKAAAAASVAGLAGCFPGVGGRWVDAGKCADPAAGATSDAAVPPAVTPAVVEVFNPKSVVVGAKLVIQPDVVATMLDAGLMALAGQVKIFNAGLSAQDGGANSADPGQPQPDSVVDNPWKVLLPNYQSGMRIGLKVNCLSGAFPTSMVILNAIIASLRDKLGVDPTTIVVWDRYLADVTGRGKYTSAALSGAKLMGNLVDDPKEAGIDGTLTPDGPGYGPKVVGCLTPRVSRVLLENTDLTINCPVLKTHYLTGFTAAMKTVYGIIDDPPGYHDNIQTALPLLYAVPAIRNSIRLTILEALGAVVAGENSSGPDSTPGRIVLAQDPVAIDSYALDLMNQIRAALPNPAKPIGADVTHWLDNAVAQGLGTRNYSLIKV